MFDVIGYGTTSMLFSVYFMKTMIFQSCYYKTSPVYYSTGFSNSLFILLHPLLMTYMQQ